MNETWWVSDTDLDDRQKNVISLDLDGSFLVVGPPGSGKTNLLLLRAKYLTLAKRPDIKVILFTRALREFVTSGAEKYEIPPDRIVTSQHFWENLLYEYGVRRPQESDFRAQRHALVSRVTKLIDENHLRDLIDTILLDEAHDFLPEEVEIFSRLSRHIFAVADHRQKIYSGEAPFSVLDRVIDQKITLVHHYRNGYNICRFADKLGRDRDSFSAITPTNNYDESSHPSHITIHKCNSLEEEIDRVFEKLDDQLKAYPEELIGIISPSKETIDRVWDRIRSSKYRNIASFQGDSQILSFNPVVRICISTLHTAKGLEYRALHVVGCENFKRRPLPRSLAFTAVTRAKTSLSLYYSGDLLGFLEQAIDSLEPLHELPDPSDVFPKE